MAFEELGITDEDQSALTRKAILGQIQEKGSGGIAGDAVVTDMVLEIGEKHAPELLETAEERIGLFAEANELTFFEAARLIANTAISNVDLIGTISCDLSISRWDAITGLAQSELKSKGGING